MDWGSSMPMQILYIPGRQTKEMLKNQIQNQTRKKNNKAEKIKLLNGFRITKKTLTSSKIEPQLNHPFDLAKAIPSSTMRLWSKASGGRFFISNHLASVASSPPCTLEESSFSNPV